MEVFAFKTSDEAQDAVSGCLADQIAGKADSVLGIATGGTMEAVYQKLVRRLTTDRISMSGCRTFNLDEYAGIPPDHPNSYRSYMRAHLFAFVDVPRSRQHIPDTTIPVAKTISRYQKLLDIHGPLDIQLLGLGHNGHIGFNEPGTPFDTETRITSLSPQTVSANARYFSSAGDVPQAALTMGIRSILQAQRIVLLATGAAKANAVHRMICGPVSEDCPASALRRHENAEIYLDADAASRLPESLLQAPRQRDVAPPRHSECYIERV